MRVSKVALLVLSPLGLASASDGYNLTGVEDQISAYLDQNPNPSLEGRTLQKFGCAIACGFLAFTQPGQVAYPSSPNYSFQESQYWSQQQAETSPACHFTPMSALDVSLAVLTARATRCKFAVKSGGHAAYAGASNIESGLTINLAKINEVVVAEDKKTTSVGAGNVWYDVYTQLQPMGLTVIGGRVSAIGVGGLTLGGGISFFSSRYGWACDNVVSYEVVLADGSIRRVHYDSRYSDLYWALRGGGNNFGIVTRFELETYPQGEMWAGAQTFLYSDETSAALNNAFYHLGINAEDDPNAQMILAYAYAQAQGVHVIASDLQYSKPTPFPAIFKNFTDVQGPIVDTLRIVNLTDLTIEFNNTNPGGFRQSYWTFTVQNSASLMREMVAIFQDEVEGIKDAPSIVPSFVFQLITTDMTKHFSKRGGNPLGLAGQGPLNVINISISWGKAADDERILAAARNMVNRSAAAATKEGLDHPYLYQNYASKEQKVFESYGEDNLVRLKSIRAKYDPTQVYQKLQPGYFKLE